MRLFWYCYVLHVVHGVEKPSLIIYIPVRIWGGPLATFPDHSHLSKMHMLKKSILSLEKKAEGGMCMAIQPHQVYLPSLHV